MDCHLNNMDTSGFYKFYTSLLYGPTLVVSADFELYRDQKDTYNYPINGWYWFDSDSDARSFFGLPTLFLDSYNSICE